MSEYTLEELEYFLKDEQERAEKCEDPYTKELLLKRCVMYERAIIEIKHNTMNEPNDIGVADAADQSSLSRPEDES